MLVIPEETKEYFNEVQNIVNDNLDKLSLPWNKALTKCHLYGCTWDEPWNSVFLLYKDFAPLSFSFIHYRILNRPEECKLSNPELFERDIETGQLKHMFDNYYYKTMHGGLIYQGLNIPANGSSPSFTVSIGDQTEIGWFMHT